MNERLIILEYSLGIEDLANRIILFVFNVDQKNDKLIYYFKSTSIREKVTLLRDMNLIDEKLLNKINNLSKMRNLLIHNQEIATFASIPNRKLISEILSITKTLPANWDKLSEKSLNTLLANSLGYLYQDISEKLNLVLIESEKKFKETVFTQQKKDALLTYKALNNAMKAVFNELGQYGLSKKKIEQIKSRHIDLFVDELEKLAPEKFGNNMNQTGAST